MNLNPVSKTLYSYTNTRYSNAVTEREASLEGQIQDRRDTPEEFFDEIIDPTFLYPESSSFPFENHASARTVLEGNDNSAPFFRNTQYSRWADVSSGESEHSEIETPHQPPQETSGDSLAEPQIYERLGPKTLNIDNYDEPEIKTFESDEPSYGFVISSGWSSTFFPCGLEEEPQS